MRHSLREVEKARLDARRELQDLRRQVDSDILFIIYTTESRA